MLAVIPVRGVIFDRMVEKFNRWMSSAEHDPNVKAVVVEIDTPGGGVTASDEIHQRIKRFKAAKQVPVVVCMRGTATSGGYYIACAGDYIMAEPTTLTGTTTSYPCNIPSRSSMDLQR